LADHPATDDATVGDDSGRISPNKARTLVLRVCPETS
jgi:hypothetical protein